MRRTRILATLGPATAAPDVLRDLLVAGADAVRLNFSHGDPAAHAAVAASTRAEAQRLGRCLTMLQDLGGPKIRTGLLATPLELLPGASLQLIHGSDVGTPADGHSPARVFTSFAPLFTSVSPGQHLLLDDGRIDLVVTDVESGRLTARVVLGGRLDSRKGMHMPGSHVRTPAVTDKDRADLHAGVAMGVDVAALSFVQTPEDIQQARDAARAAGAPDLPIIAKIERPQAVDLIDEIVAVSDGIMVARGDLGIELPLETLPSVQARIIRAARRRGIPVILATEVLESMRTSPRPTRAEVTDAAHAVHEGVDAIMLSGETAVGQHPARTVATLSAIIEEAERLPLTAEATVAHDDVLATRHGLALCEAAVALAERSGARAIVAVTKAGKTPRLLSALRPSARIIAATPSAKVAQRLGLVRSVTPLVTEAATLAAVRDMLLARALVPPGEPVVFVSMQAALSREPSNFITVEQM